MLIKKDIYCVGIHFVGIILGLIGLALLDNVAYHAFYIVALSMQLVLSIVIDKSGWIRPYSYLVLSFFVFVWMRFILNLVFDTDIISVGNAINMHNTNMVSVYLGLAMNVICITAIVTSRTLAKYDSSFMRGNSKIRIPKYAENTILMISLLFFALFLYDSFSKINVIQMHDYLNVSETVLVSGYRWFSLGKWTLLIWIILGRDDNRFFKGSSIMAMAGMGYLMRGARGYAIMYMFLWLLFFSQKKKIRIIPLAIFGISLLYLANFILSYRLGWSVASGFKNVIQSVLYQQGASVEPVFGSVIFRSKIMQEFSYFELFTRNDFGLVVDRMRGVNWESGGFGSSFFAETFFLGFPLCLIMLIVVGICVGFVECAYQFTRVNNLQQRNQLWYVNSSYMSIAEFGNIILFMTIPNLVYLGRSSIKDFIVKTIMVIVILCIIRSRSQKNEKEELAYGKS